MLRSLKVPHPPTLFCAFVCQNIFRCQKGSFLGGASFSEDKATDVSDTLGSGRKNLDSSGFFTGKVAKGSKISILAFEVNTITQGANLVDSVSKENVSCIKEEIIPSKPVQYLVSTDSRVLLGLAALDSNEERRSSMTPIK